MTVIDVHTHMFTARWLELLKREGGIYNIKTRPDGQQEIFRGDTPVVIPQRGHFDYLHLYPWLSRQECATSRWLDSCWTISPF